MKLNLFIGSALFAASIFGAPNAEYGAERPVLREISSDELHYKRKTTFRRQQTTHNWAGAVLYAASGEQLQSVEATFNVPIPRSPGTAVTIGVGIDGADNDGTVSAQIFISLRVDLSGTISYTGGYWWSPDPIVEIDQNEFSFAAGDELYFLLVAYANSANLYMKNTNSGQIFELLFQPSDPNNVILGQSVEWIAQTNGDENLMNFTTITFSSCNASNTLLQYKDLSGALSINMVSSEGYTIASGSIPNTSTVETTYNGT